MKMAKILVTGGSGFLGAALVKELDEMGHMVSYFSRNAYKGKLSEKIKWIQGDLKDKNACHQAVQGQDVIFHAGAIAGYWGKWKDYYQTNFLGTKYLLDASVECKVPYFIYTSSPSVVFNGKDLQNVDEKIAFPKSYLCHYSRSKALAEKLVSQYGKEGKILSISLRPHLIWGPGDQHLLPRIIQRAKIGKLKIVGSGENMVDMIYIDNAVEGHVKGLEALIRKNNKISGNCYFISDPKPVKIWQWTNQLLRLLGTKEVQQKISYRVAYHIGHLLEMSYFLFCIKAEPPMTRFLAHSLATDHYFNLSKAREDLHYEGNANLELALEKTINYLRQFQ